MFSITLNNNNLHIPITSLCYDFLNLRCNFTNVDIEEWPQEIISFINSLKEQSITIIQIYKNNQLIRTYNNTQGRIVRFEHTYRYINSDEAIITAEVDLDFN